MCFLLTFYQLSNGLKFPNINFYHFFLRLCHAALCDNGPYRAGTALLRRKSKMRCIENSTHTGAGEEVPLISIQLNQELS